MGNADMNDNHQTFVVCEMCKKRLIERKQNGLWYFCFGKGEAGSNKIPVEMYIHGSIKLKCLRRNCGHWNVLNYFPQVFEEVQSDSPKPQVVQNNNKLRRI